MLLTVSMIIMYASAHATTPSVVAKNAAKENSSEQLVFHGGHCYVYGIGELEYSFNMAPQQLYIFGYTIDSATQMPTTLNDNGSTITWTNMWITDGTSYYFVENADHMPFEY